MLEFRCVWTSAMSSGVGKCLNLALYSGDGGDLSAIRHQYHWKWIWRKVLTSFWIGVTARSASIFATWTLESLSLTFQPMNHWSQRSFSMDTAGFRCALSLWKLQNVSDNMFNFYKILCLVRLYPILAFRIHRELHCGGRDCKHRQGRLFGLNRIRHAGGSC